MGEAWLEASKQQRARAGVPRSDGWTEARRWRFLEHLAATCDIKGSCRHAGRGERSAFYLRLRDPEFAAQWQAAIEAGYDRIEAMLMARALGRRLEPDEAGQDPDFPDIETMDLNLALDVLRMRQTQRAGGKRNAGPTAKPVSKRELVDALGKRIARLRAHGGGS